MYKIMQVVQAMSLGLQPPKIEIVFSGGLSEVIAVAWQTLGIGVLLAALACSAMFLDYICVKFRVPRKSRVRKSLYLAAEYLWVVSISCLGIGACILLMIQLFKT